ncbi:hypothetical protein BHM03_00053839 [Ensete ventricosum]|nr:hypothetical protein BHM03_00053839 [Ensete ventricosum]
MLALKTADNLTKIWSFPWKTEFTVCISFSLSTSDETSQTEPVILRFKALHCCKHSLSSASFREQCSGQAHCCVTPWDEPER